MLESERCSTCTSLIPLLRSLLYVESANIACGTSPPNAAAVAGAGTFGARGDGADSLNTRLHLRISMSTVPDYKRRKMWIGSIVIDCTNLSRMIEFWSEALHYVPRDPPSSDGVILKDPDGRGPNLNLSLSGEGPLEEYRIHLDLYAPDPLAEVERLIKLGATMKLPAQKGHDFVTLADPDGNLFDVIDINWSGDERGWWFGRSPSA